jgi:hypothetical protein
MQKAIAALEAVFGAEVEKEAKTFGEEMEQEQLRRIASQVFDFCYALSDSR